MSIVHAVNGKLLQHIILFGGKRNSAFVQIYDIIAYFLQIGRYVRRNQDRSVSASVVIVQHIQNLVSYHRIQSAGRFVQNKQSAVAAQRAGNSQLHFHAFGKLFNLYFFGQLHLSYKPEIFVAVPCVKYFA